jgi:hypothetical protein
VSSFNLQIPRSKLNTSGSKVEVPRSKLDSSGFDLQVPRSKLNTSGFKAEVPRSKLDSSGFDPQIPRPDHDRCTSRSLFSHDQLKYFTSMRGSFGLLQLFPSKYRLNVYRILK